MDIHDYFEEFGGDEADFLRKYNEQIVRNKTTEVGKFSRLLDNSGYINPYELIEFLLIWFSLSDDPESDEKENILKKSLIRVMKVLEDHQGIWEMTQRSLELNLQSKINSEIQLQLKINELQSKLAECDRIVRNRKVINEAAAMRALPEMPQMQDPKSGKYIQSFFGMPKLNEVPDLQDIEGGKKRRKRRSLRRSLRR
jgi:hypothetical protein